MKLLPRHLAKQIKIKRTMVGLLSIVALAATVLSMRWGPTPRRLSTPSEDLPILKAVERLPLDIPAGHRETSILPAEVTADARYDDRVSDDLPRDISLGGDPFSEPIDPAWAPGMEGTIDSLIRAIGWPLSDAEVRCLTTMCSVHLFYQPSFLFLEEELSADAQQSLLIDLSEALEPVLVEPSRLSSLSGAPLVLLSSFVPNGSDRGVPEGFFLDVEGIVGGSFVLSGETPSPDTSE